ncbi:MAG: putative porin [Flavobacteriaceae bacterium]|jgi:hypothetical protein|nr:putative porin [Flavobacteriaceae bacterium]
MKKIFHIIVFFLLFGIFAFSQETKEKELNSNIKSSSDNDSLKTYNPTIQSYRYWTEDQPKASFDTVLTLDKYYKNRMYNHKDYFGTMPFSNIGQVFNPLLYTADLASPIDLIPFGKKYYLLGINDIRYFDVQTPMTEFLYNNGYKEGHSLSSLFTHNPNSQINYSIQYNGLRSQGKYQNQLAAINTLLFTGNYHTKNQRYKLWTHFMIFNANNQENGGILNLEDFESNTSDFNRNRNRIAVNLTNADSKYQKRRFYLAQQYGIFRTSDSLKREYPLSLKNVFYYETAHYKYEDAANSFIPSMVFDSIGNVRNNTKSLSKLTDAATLAFRWGNKLDIEAGVKYENLDLYADRQIDPTIDFPENVKDNRFGFTGNLTFNWKEGIVLKTQAEAMTGKTFKNSFFIDNYLTVQPIQNYYLEAHLGVKSQMPALNLLYNQSFYTDYNYYNFDSFSNEKTIAAGAALRLKPFNTRLSAQVFNIGNYTYLDSLARPKQSSSDVRIIQVGLQNSFTYSKFHLETNFVCQKVAEGAEVLPLPDFIGRATLYYQNKIFKKNAEVQAGLNIYYFSDFKSREFFPVVNEFKLQSNGENFKMGNFPMIDVFIHFKVKRMLIIFEGQHVNASLTGYNFYSAPRVPYTDFRLNVGILWYIFT